jgi:hypothetical protein
MTVPIHDHHSLGIEKRNISSEDPKEDEIAQESVIMPNARHTTFSNP